MAGLKTSRADGAKPLHADTVSRVRHWMFDVALPFWVERGVDRANGGPVESLTPSGDDSGSPFKRTRVIGRQLYAFSHAACLGYDPAKEASDHVWAFLRDRVWQGPEAGWPRQVAPSGHSVLDDTPDLYDYAFALFALGWRYKLTGEAEALEIAHQTLDILNARFRHDLGGFLHELPAALPRQQNPHMHLAEAAILLADAAGDARFLELANELVKLFKSRIVRMPSGVLPEFFEDDWKVYPGQEAVEPGHQFEWAWILANHQKLTSTDNSDVIAALVGFAERHGFDAGRGHVYASVSPDGSPIEKGTRTWPSTERIKGWIGMSEINGVEARGKVDESVDYLLQTHLSDPQVPGTWVERYDAKGQLIDGDIPASTLYHVFLAFAEVLRWYPAEMDVGRGT